MTDTAAAPLVRIHALAKHYRRGNHVLPVLSGIDLDIWPGDFLALMGPSGSGKSTLLNLIAGIDRPSSGRIAVQGLDITRLPDRQLAAWRAAHVGFIFQFYNLMPVLTAIENVELPLLLSPLSARQRKEHALLALQLVGLWERRGHYPSQLSGGEQQRVAIARAVVTDPSLIVADEPTGDLDRRSAEDILHLMERLNRELCKTILMVTHDQRAASQAHRILHLDKGVLNGERQNPPWPSTPAPTRRQSGR